MAVHPSAGEKQCPKYDDDEATGQAAAAISNLSLQQEDAAEVTFWSLAKILVETMYHNLCSHQSISHHDLDHMPPYLHQMCVLFVPGDLIRYALARHPEQAQISYDVGKWKHQLPLHLVSRFTKHASSTIRNIIEANRKAAQIRDGDGMLPLQLAIKAQRCWENGTGDILIAHPEALGALGGLYCPIYPFILQRIARNNKAQQVQALFRILRSRPDLVHQKLEERP